MSIEDTIKSNARYHSHLIQSIADLDYVPSTLQAQQQYLKDLRSQLENTRKHLESLAKTTQQEREEHERLRDSTTKKFVYRLSGKKDVLASRVEKEEREFVEAFDNEMKERESKGMLENMVKEAEEEERSLQAKQTQLDTLKRELNDLYHNTFDGPTREFPQEDELELAYEEALHKSDKINSDLARESQAVGLLISASRLMQQCNDAMQQAKQFSTYDVWGGGGMTDMMERNALAQAGQLATKTDMLVQQAQHASSKVKRVPGLEVPQISMMGDIFFDNIFSDLAAHEKIKSGAIKLQMATQTLSGELRSARNRADALGRELETASKTLAACRQELNDFRRQTFESIAASQPAHANQSTEGGVSASIPPGYSDAPPGYSSPPPLSTSTSMSSFEMPEETAAMPEASPAEERPAQTPMPSWGNRNPYAARINSQ